jgi:starvation-inducible outer membrane lipoprotein
MQMRKFFILIVALLLTACVGPANYNDNPNSIQRADIVSKNEKGITVEHSTWGKKIAFRFADEHCKSLGKASVYLGASSQYGPDVISTWRCE